MGIRIRRLSGRPVNADAGSWTRGERLASSHADWRHVCLFAVNRGRKICVQSSRSIITTGQPRGWRIDLSPSSAATLWRGEVSSSDAPRTYTGNKRAWCPDQMTPARLVRAEDPRRRMVSDLHESPARFTRAHRARILLPSWGLDQRRPAPISSEPRCRLQPSLARPGYCPGFPSASPIVGRGNGTIRDRESSTSCSSSWVSSGRRRRLFAMRLTSMSTRPAAIMKTGMTFAQSKTKLSHGYCSLATSVLRGANDCQSLRRA
ncbi:hypothetical protein ACVIHF_008656 [Bradyrhizobium sp. USDA 4506]